MASRGKRRQQRIEKKRQRDTAQRYRRGKRRKMTKFRLGEVSAVDRPAQEPATVAIIKGDEVGHSTQSPESNDKPMDKAYGDLVDLLTATADGHQHGIRLHHDADGVSLFVGMASSEDGVMHGHQLVRLPDGTYAMSENHGHTHEIDAAAVVQVLMGVMTKADDDSTLDDCPLTFAGLQISDLPEVRKALDPAHQPEHKPKSEDLRMTDLQKALERIEALERENATLVKVANLSDAQRAHYKSLSLEHQAAFLQLTPHARDAELEKALAANEVVYTDANGIEYRKNDDARLVDQARRSDELSRQLAKARQREEEIAVAKQAEAFGHLPGDIETRKALVKAVAAIAEEDTRDKVLEILKAHDANVSRAFETRGVTGSPPNAGNDPEAKLQQLAKAHATAHQITEEAAFVAVLDTDEGRSLYEAARKR